MNDKYSVALCLNVVAIIMFTQADAWYGVVGVFVHCVCLRAVFDLNAENSSKKAIE